MLGENMASMVQQLNHNLTVLLQPVLSRLESAKKYSDAKLDVLVRLTNVVSDSHLTLVLGCAESGN